MIDEQKLRGLAGKATPGEWLKEGHTIYSLVHFGWRKGVEQFKNRFWASVYKDHDCPEEEREANAAWIAAANPAAILALLDELQSLRSERTAWRVTAENAEAAVKQARIDALEEAAIVCDKQVDTCLAALSMGGTFLDKQFQKSSFQLSEHLSRRIRSLKGKTP